ncbi:MAG TPA: holo-ACP synthase [Marmoricola sp.]|nr:holo-ACP synthase [Nocardioidaceae bacterium]MCO5323026.1 holo-ACP synthase [Nocardioidaceae bacterium]HRV70241.1 holo-ACP synthase [Marmoricola sp.]
MSSKSTGLMADLALGTAVLGVGVDVVYISAFSAQLEQPGTRFAAVFTPQERRHASRAGVTTGRPTQHLAARWAAKEAFLKAWSESRFGKTDVIAPGQVDFQDIEVRCDALGRPSLRLHGPIAAALVGCTTRVSLSHDLDADTAIAIVVLQEDVK